MEEKFIESAIGIADAIQLLYKKINCFQAIHNVEKEQKAKEALEQAWKLEDDLYNRIPLKDIEKYIRLIIKKNPKIYYYDFYDLIFGNIEFDSTFRVYQRLNYLEEKQHYYNEMHLESFSFQKAGSYLGNRFLIQSLYYLLQNSQNHYYNSNFVYEEEKYNIAFHFKEIETQFWKDSTKALFPCIKDEEIAFASCDKTVIHYQTDLAVTGFLERYFVDLYGGTFDYPNGDDLMLSKPLHELYLRFLFFLMFDRDSKEVNQKVLQQNLTFFPEFWDVCQNVIQIIEEDTKLRDSLVESRRVQ